MEPNALARKTPWSVDQTGTPESSDLTKLITSKCKELATQWRACIKFPVYPVHSKKENLAVVLELPPDEHDICSFLNGNRGNDKLYFSRRMYPPPCNDDDDETKAKKFKCLNVDLQSTAKAAGSPVIIGRGRVKGDGIHDYVCDYCHRKKRKSKARNDTPHRKTYLTNNDKSGRRSDVGKAGSKRINTTAKEVICPFTFSVQDDEHGFYISLHNQCGNPMHRGHPRFDPATTPDSTRHMTVDEINDAKCVMEATLNKATGRNLLMTKHGKLLSYAKLAYLDSVGKDNEDEFGALFKMFEEAEDVRYNILWSGPASDGHYGTVSSTKVADAVSNNNLEDSPYLEDVSKALHEDREGQQISPDAQVFHCIAWCNEKVFRYFKLNPEVVTCDVVSHTNRSGYHLLTFSCRTSIDKTVVFMRVWIPDQRRVSFRYVFQEVITRLIPEHIRVRVLFIMKDGDPQQGNEILQAIRMHFTNAIDGECGFHIVFKGWDRRVKGCHCVPPENLELWKKIIQGIHKWMYSWMRAGYCSDAEEYKISKLLLILFIRSEFVWKVTGGNEVLINMIVNFIHDYVVTKEAQYLHYTRKYVFYLEVFTSSGHEGTNFGLKSHSAAVQPTMTLDTSAAAMGIQDNTKAAECDHIVHRDFRNSNKTWSPWPTAPYLTSYGEGILMEEYERSSYYIARRVGSNAFQVVYAGSGCDENFVKLFLDGMDEIRLPTGFGAGSDDGTPSHDDKEFDRNDIFDCAVPLFSKVHHVTLGKESCCSCGRHQRTGLFCAHIICCAEAVCGHFGKKFPGFGHESVSVRWWSSYMYYGYKTPQNTPEAELVKLLHAKANNDTKGPCFDEDIPSSMKILDAIPAMSALDRLKNYPREVVSALMDSFDGLFSCTHNPNSDQANENDLLDKDANMIPLKAAKSAEAIFEKSVSDVLGAHKPGAGGTRAAMYPLWNQITNAHDQLKDEECDKEFEQLLQGHLSKMQAKLRVINDSNKPRGDKKKREFTTITTERYQHSAKRVFNTKQHPW